jgi:hypothetical protein
MPGTFPVRLIVLSAMALYSNPLRFPESVHASNVLIKGFQWCPGPEPDTGNWSTLLVDRIPVIDEHRCDTPPQTPLLLPRSDPLALFSSVLFPTREQISLANLVNFPNYPFDFIAAFGFVLQKHCLGRVYHPCTDYIG